MPSSIAHAFTAAAIGTPFAPPAAGRRYWIAGILCAVLLDLDAVGRPFGMGDVAFLGRHRALTHSLLFALVLGPAVAWRAFRGPRWEGRRWRVAAYLVLATASHGVLDAFAVYGPGIAFWFPFSTARYVAPWRPLQGANEIWLVWVPATLVIVLERLSRRARGNAGL